MTFNSLAILALQQSHDKSRVRALLEEARQMAQTSPDQKALAEAHAPTETMSHWSHLTL